MPQLFTLSDLHLTCAHKVELTAFGDHWRDHLPKMAARWDETVGEDDIVLVPGDVSWAPRATAFGPDADWLGERTGQIVIGPGNHDRWWRSEQRVRELLPPNARGAFPKWRPLGEGVVASLVGANCPGDHYHDARAARRWPARLRELRTVMTALRRLKDGPRPPAFSILLMHYPPFNDKGEASEMLPAIEEAGLDVLVYGHFHQQHEWERAWQGVHHGTYYAIGSADARDFTPAKIGEIHGRELNLELPAPPWTGPREWTTEP